MIQPGPSNPTDPTDPTDPSDPTEPTNPSNPGEDNSTPSPGEQPDSKLSWGEPVSHGGIQHYVSANGTTSVEVDKRGMIWLKEESDGTSAWYGLDNSSGAFEIGSQFHVRWLSKDSDPNEWATYYAQLDTEHTTAVEEDKLWIFIIGVTSPNGTEYTQLGVDVPLYIQLGADWDKDDIEAVFISDAQDEDIHAVYSDDVAYPEGTGTFAKLTLKHFSPYAIYDKLTDAEKAMQAGSMSTGDLVSAYWVTFLAITMFLAAAYILIHHKKFLE